ncbi:MAG: hypothetical protein GXP05_11840 [Alphaproteobacteria bacterium]|nr:hypothetical protein [Alphaproteobacteria bacterium]
MTFIADILLLVAAFSAAFYCRVLAVRLKRLSNTDKGLGGAITGLSVQVDEMKSTLKAVAVTADRRAVELSHLTEKAERSTRRLELLLASLHGYEDQNDAQRAADNTPPVLRLSTRDHRPDGADAADAGRSASRLLSRNRSRPNLEYVP